MSTSAQVVLKMAPSVLDKQTVSCRSPHDCMAGEVGHGFSGFV